MSLFAFAAGAVTATAIIAGLYFDRRKLKAQARAAEGKLLSDALKVGAALRAKEANVKSAIKAEVELALADGWKELQTVGVDAQAVLSKVGARIRALL